MTVKNWLKKSMLLCFIVAGMLAGCGKEGGTEPVSPTVGATSVPNSPTPTESSVPAEGLTLTPTPELTMEEQFDVYIDTLFKQEIVLNTINLHYTLAYPENFGITEYEPSLGSFGVEEMKASYGALHQLKTELEAFDYKVLTKEQQFTYDVIMDYIETELLVEDLILYTEILGPTTGYQAQLPVLLAEYKFRTVQDIEDYLALVALVDEIFAELVEFEREKSEAGFFMADDVADAVIDQCRQFIAEPDENYMIDVFETKIAAFEGLSEEEKQTYIARNKELVTTELVTAYQTLIDGLEALKGTGKNDKGLYYFQDGKRYYEYLVRSLTGSAKSVEELMEKTFTYVDESVGQMFQIATLDPVARKEWESYEFCETEPEKILEDLLVKIQVDFPEISETTYTIKYVHPSMEEHMSPAFYLTQPIDDTSNHVIYINQSQLTEDLYTTMAHEGYPGHLYQNAYMMSQNLPLIRSMFSNQGYSEGWATYVEYYAYDLGGLSKNLAEILRLEQSSILGMYAYVDMGIHYLGWGTAEVKDYLAHYGLDDIGLVQKLFALMIEEPGAYLSYFIGYLEFLELRDVAQEVWGESYTLKKFHEAVLSLGPAPFDLLEQEIRNYNE